MFLVEPGREFLAGFPGALCAFVIGYGIAAFREWPHPVFMIGKLLRTNYNHSSVQYSREALLARSAHNSQVVR